MCLRDVNFSLVLEIGPSARQSTILDRVPMDVFLYLYLFLPQCDLFQMLVVATVNVWMVETAHRAIKDMPYVQIHCHCCRSVYKRCRKLETLIVRADLYTGDKLPVCGKCNFSV